MRATLILVGGFLGAGKTSLMLAAAARLREAGHRVGAITNDQGASLVDTHLAGAAGLDSSEVAGGCFCCRFSDFVRSAEYLLETASPGVILAEPVGSCTDLTATVMRPLRRFWHERFHVAPLTVLVDPGRMREPMPPDLAYLFERQIAEADLLRFSKADRYSTFPELPGARPISARTGAGVAEWLDEVMGGEAGLRPLEIDYQRYGDAEAMLGWLNWRAEVRLRRALSPAMLAGPLLDDLERNLTEAGIRIAHLKVFAEAPTGYVKASICANGQEPDVEGMLDASPAARHRLVLNLRAAASPDALTGALEAALEGLPGKRSLLHREAFRPARPVPEHRLME